MSKAIKPLKLILLVDDDDTTNFVNTRLLTNMNIAEEIKAVRNGKEAIEFLKKACSENPEAGFVCPDLIFLDIKMPVMDGFTFLEKYKEEGLDKMEHVIIMMLTSSASFYDLEKLKSYDTVKKHISKSLTEASVNEILKQHFGQKA
ncbi:response regulator [Adhaeribacter sp. BT258]|uniref:Response regulator n=1 Tax=Adhaeribacter terrigena TaxID=2793070 RepID=A0ABS1C1C8_9BACT|nr:response regulator [Adhaeribacter terrigena]MBK0402350.1 response regulator [Adhaeribacter terrigena]